jgi:hypothetical protein
VKPIFIPRSAQMGISLTTNPYMSYPNPLALEPQNACNQFFTDSKKESSRRQLKLPCGDPARLLLRIENYL